MFSRRLNTALIVAIVAAAIAWALALTLSTDAAAQPAATPVVEQMHVVEPTTEPTDDEAFIADLFGPDTDVSAEQQFELTELAHRYCDKVVTGVGHVPGAEQQTREGWAEGLVASGWSPSEANKFLDVAEGNICPRI